MIHKKHNKIKLHNVLLPIMMIALLAAAATFMGTSAAGSSGVTADDLGEPKIVMTTNKAVGETLTFELDISTAYVDLGDGNIVTCNGEKSLEAELFPETVDYRVYYEVLAGDTIKIYSLEDITYFSCGYSELTALDVSNNTALERLDCIENKLKKLDVSKNNALTFLECNSNNLTALDLSKNTALNSLNCSDNNLKFSTIKVSLER